MRYRDLVQFDPIQTVIHLREADRKEEAGHLVRTFVLSNHMAERLAQVILPQLQFDRPLDQKGILIVGNYGTGKSHLMSVLSAIAEHADLVQELGNAEVADAARQGVAGKFQVLRTEIGATRMPLRDILFGHLETFLADRGLEFHFPSLSEAPNSKDPLMGMMSRFHERYPDHGLLIVVDELLDYLRSRSEHELILDLNYMREVGEICRSTRLRFIGGVQESLFDSPRFQFVAETVRRVRDRFEQMRIMRSDVAFVVAERLLRKTPDQRAWIHRHLERFAPLYPALADRLEEYVRLFPVHPTYLDVFERISLVEQREVLRTLSRTMQARLDEAVPADQPGLIAYDDYWTVLQEDPTLRTLPEVREVVDVSRKLEERIQAAYTQPAYRPLALRIIHGLSVLRLTTGDVHAPLGATAAELRDGLCLHVRTPEPDPDFLLGTVNAALREIIRTMSGQFISYNQENGQYYLDLRKIEDYDEKVAQKAEVLGADELNRYYFQVLKRVLEQSDSTYVPGFAIWQHEVSWPGHRVTRPGYLFFGAPNERSTAQPPRDFYLYFLQPYDPPVFEDHALADEVFFRLSGPDTTFDAALRTYAGAQEMALLNSGDKKQAYIGRADGALQVLQRWLRQNMAQAITVTYQGATRRLADWSRQGPRPGSDLSVRELVDAVASACLSAYFGERYSEYPSFPGIREDMTEGTRGRYAQEALRWLAGTRTQTGATVLDGLELLEDGQVRPDHSRYARAVLERIAPLRPGEVLNRSALLIAEGTGPERDRSYRLEPEWLVVVLLALAHFGELVLQVAGEKIDASNLELAARLPMETLADFRFVERRRDVPVAAWVAVFETLELPAGQIQSADTYGVAIDTLQRQVNAELERTVRAQETVRQGIVFWHDAVLSPNTQAHVQDSLSAYKGFLEGLRVFTIPGRLRNLRLTEEEIRAQGKHRAWVRHVERLNDLVQALQPVTAYLREAEALLPEGAPLVGQIQDLRRAQLSRVRQSIDQADAALRQALQRELDELRGDYVEFYTGLHRRARLEHAEDDRKRRLTTDPRLRRLKALSGIHLLPVERLSRLEAELQSLVACWRLVPSDLRSQALCPHCSYRPALDQTSAHGAVLDKVDDELDRLAASWIELLRAELTRREVAETIDLLEPEPRTLLRTFLAQGAFPDQVGQTFVAAVNAALQGMERVSLGMEEILLALAGDGTPVPPDMLQQRFERYLAEKLADHDPDRVRLTVGW